MNKQDGGAAGQRKSAQEPLGKSISGVGRLRGSTAGAFVQACFRGVLGLARLSVKTDASKGCRRMQLRTISCDCLTLPRQKWSVRSKRTANLSLPASA